MAPWMEGHAPVFPLDDDDFVATAYRILLRREPDEEGRRRAVRELSEKTLSRAALVAELTASRELAIVRALDDALALAGRARAAGDGPWGIEGPAGHDERVVEVAWTLGRYRGERRVLDVGFAHAEPLYLAALAELGADAIVGVDIVAAD